MRKLPVTPWDSQGIIQKMMTSSLEIQFKYKFAINLYTICISLGIIFSLCCGCSGKHFLLVCFLTVLVWPAFRRDCFTGPKICLHQRAQANKSKNLTYKNGNKMLIRNSETQLIFLGKYCAQKDHRVLLTINSILI